MASIATSKVNKSPRPTALQETFRIEKALKQKEELPRLIVLEGEEAYYINRIEKAIVDNYIAPENVSTDRIILYGLDTSFDQINEVAKGHSLFASRQLIVVREAQLLSDINRLADLAPDISAQKTLLVVFRGSIESNKKKLWSKLLALPTENLWLISSPAIKNKRDIFAIITQSAKKYQCTIEEKAKESLVEKIGFNGSIIDNEIGKLALAAGAFPITDKMVEALVGFAREYSMRDFYTAVTKLQRKEAFSIAQVMIKDEKNYPLPMIVATLWSFFTNMLAVCYISNELRSPDHIAKTLGLRNKYAADEYLAAINRFPPKHLVEIIHTLRMTDAKFKGANDGTYKSGDLLMNLLYAIFH